MIIKTCYDVIPLYVCILKHMMMKLEDYKSAEQHKMQNL